jgi:hypothetical protein
MTGLLHYCQLFAAIAWMVPELMLAPAIARVWRGKATRRDALDSHIFYTGFVQIGFTARWLIWPNPPTVMSPAELSTWSALWFLSGIGAIAGAISIYMGRKP